MEACLCNPTLAAHNSHHGLEENKVYHFMCTIKKNDRPSIREILANQSWEEKEYLQVSENQINEFIGSFSGVSEAVYKTAIQLDTVLDEAFIKKLRLCASCLEVSFPHPYEHVVLAIAMALDDLKRKIISTYDTENGSIIEANLPINLLYIFIAVNEGLLKLEIIDQEKSTTRVIVHAQVVGVFLLKKDWGRGKRNIQAVINKTSDYLNKMSLNNRL